MNENNPSESVPGAEQNVPAAEGTENVAVASLKDIVKQATGRDFSTDEAALKSIQETYSFVGKRMEPQIVEKAIIPDEVNQKISSLENAVRESNFYAEHSDLKPYKDLISSLGQDPEKVIQTDVFKNYVEKAKLADETTKSKSVLQTNPRLGQVTDKLTQAKEALASGNDAAARSNAVAAVMEAYDI